MKHKDIKQHTGVNALPVVPIQDVLACISDDDWVISCAGKEYYKKHYINKGGKTLCIG